MKKFTFFLLLCVSQLAICQSDDMYDTTMSQVQENYNAKNVEGIHNLFSQELKDALSLSDLTTQINESLEKRGTLDDMSFISDDELGKTYLTQFENAAPLLIVKLNAENKLTTFEFQEY